MPIRLYNNSGGYIDLNAGGTGSAANTFTLPAETGTLLTTASAKTSIPGNGSLTEADIWCLTTTFGAFSGNSLITSNWARWTGESFTQLGTGMTQSSGVFTFPSTGWWLITAQGFFVGTGSIYNGVRIAVSSDGGSNFDIATNQYNAVVNSSDHAGAYTSYIYKVTSTTNNKAGFYAQTAGSVNLRGSTTEIETGATFLKIASL